MTDLATLIRRADRELARPAGDFKRLEALTVQIERQRYVERRAGEILATRGPGRTHALAVTENGVKRVPVRRAPHECRGVHCDTSIMTTLEFVGDRAWSEPCKVCGRSVSS